MAKKKDWEVTHYGPTRWEGPSEKKHYSRHASLDEANTHARKLAHKTVPKGMHVEHSDESDADDPMHSYHHIDPVKKKMGDSLFVQKVGSQEKWEKEADAGLHPEETEAFVKAFKPLIDKHFAFKKTN